MNKKNRKVRKLTVSRRTLRRLAAADLGDANGGTSTMCTVSWLYSCYQNETCLSRAAGCQSNYCRSA